MRSSDRNAVQDFGAQVRWDSTVSESKASVGGPEWAWGGGRNPVEARCGGTCL